MGIVRNQTTWSTVLTYLGIIIGYVNVGYFFPKILSEEDFGLRSVLMEFSIVSGYLATFGTSGAIQKFLYPFSKDGEANKKAFITTSLILFTFGTILTLGLIKLNEGWIIEFYSLKSPLFVDYLYLTYPLIVLIASNYFFESILVSSNESKTSFFGKEVLIRLLLFGTICLLVFKVIDVKTFWLLFVLNYLIVLIFYFIYTVKKGLFKISFQFLPFNKVEKVVEFSFFSLLGTFAGILVLKIDVLMLAGLSQGGIRDVAVYSMCILMTSVIESPRRVLSQVAVPFITKYFEEKDMSSLDALYKKTSSTLLVVGGGLFLGIWFSLDVFYEIAPKGEFFALGKNIVFILGLSKIVEMTFGTSAQIIAYSDKFKYSLPLTISLAILTVVTNSMLIPVYGITGAAIATLFCYCIINLARLVLVYLCFKIQPFTYKTFIGLIVLVCLCGVGTIFEIDSNVFINGGIKLVFVGGLYASLMYGLRISPDINDFIDLQLKKLKIK